MNTKNDEISKLQAELSSHQQDIERFKFLLQENKEEFKTQLAAESSAKIDATRNLESSLLEKDAELSQHKEDMKDLSNQIASMESKVISLQLLNDNLSAERDELTQFKREAEENTKAKDLKLDEFSLQTNSLREDCRKLEEQLRDVDVERDVVVRKLDLEAHAMKELEDDSAEKAKEIECLREYLRLKTNKIEELTTKISSLEAQGGNMDKMDRNDDDIATLAAANKQLTNKVEELDKDLQRQVAKFKMAQQAISGLEITLKVRNTLV